MIGRGFEVAVERLDGRRVHGLGRRTCDKGFGCDVDALARAYREAVGAADAEALYVVSSGYDPATGESDLFVGGEDAHDGLEPLELPGGLYARVEVAPRSALFWGAAVGKIKRRFYAQWLPASGYSARNLEFELHGAESRAKRPRADLLFAIEEPAGEEAR